MPSRSLALIFPARCFVAPIFASVFGVVAITLSLAANAVGYQHAPAYAQSTWASLHADAGNSKFVPLTLTPNIQRKWHLLKGAGIWSAPTISPDGSLYVTSGRGRGHAQLHAISSTGATRWQSAVYETDEDLDTLALLSAPVLDDAGNIYVGDSNQLWAYRSDGSVKWVKDLAQAGVGAPIITAIIAGREGQYVGGVSVWGRVGLFHRDTGRLAMPVLDLPGGSNPVGEASPSGLWSGGLVAEDSRETVWEILNGSRYEVTTTPAVNRETGRIFVVASGVADQSTPHSLLYAIDIESKELKLAFAARIPQGSATTPSLSPDGRTVYGMAGTGVLYAIDAATGRAIWSLPLGSKNVTPSVSDNNTVFVPADNNLVAVDGDRGEILWRRGYSAFAGDRMPMVRDTGSFLSASIVREYGRPDSFVDSVVTVTEGRLWTTLKIGYHIEVGSKRRIHSASSYLVSINPISGDLLDSWPIPDTNDGGISISPTGDIYLSLLSIGASQAWGGGYARKLPETIRVPQPQGGLLAFTPVRQVQQLQVGFNRIRRQVQKPWSIRNLKQARAQTQAMQSSAERALGVGEIDRPQYVELSGFLSTFASNLSDCIEHSRCKDTENMYGQLAEQLKALRN